jgi:pyruvate formate lyase activating enzyme
MNFQTSSKTENTQNRQLKIGGLTALTSIDYPDELSAVVFCQGCPWRCRYCHNRELVKRNRTSGFQWKEILKRLELRCGFLDAVVFSGGEPTLQVGILDAVNDIKSLGFKAGLHTAGCYPDRLEKLLPSLDWVGFDIKANAEDYAQLTGVPGSGERAWQSLQLLVNSNANFEVRITVHGELLATNKLLSLLQSLGKMKIKNLALQHCRSGNTLDQSLGTNPVDWKNSICIDYAQQHFEKVILRLST